MLEVKLSWISDSPCTDKGVLQGRRRARSAAACSEVVPTAPRLCPDLGCAA